LLCVTVEDTQLEAWVDGCGGAQHLVAENVMELVAHVARPDHCLSSAGRAAVHAGWGSPC